MKTVKLFNCGTLENGTTRLQSQLLSGKDSADYILKDGTLYNWGKGNKGFDFYPIDIDYVIVDDIKDMRMQVL